MIIEAGKIQAYRVFDIGSEINLPLATELFQKAMTKVSKFQLRRSMRSIIIAEKPVVVSLGEWQQEIEGTPYSIIGTAKIWSFGTISMRFTIYIDKKFSLEQLGVLGRFLENDHHFHNKSLELTNHLIDVINPAITQPKLWEEYEDYLIFIIDKASELNGNLKEAFVSHEISALILTEKPTTFSQEILDGFKNSVHQYAHDDLVLIHWNGAVIHDVEDSHDLSDMIEFSLSQLLELRYYDHLLDQQLADLYQKIEEKQPGLWKNPYAKLSKAAALQYIDISEIVDRVTNAFKITGDFYYAQIYKRATEQFQISSWRTSVDRKLGNLAQVSSLFQGEVDERRNQFMEATIIVLIAIEVIPLIYTSIQKFFPDF